MSAPMTDERLAEIEAARHRLYRAVYTSGYPGAGQAFETVAAEIDRLRAELAARPEPIGYSVLSPLRDGSYAFIGTEWGCRSFATPPKNLGRIVVALVPVDGTP